MSFRHRKPNITQKSAVTALFSLLHGCTDERLASFTAASLAGSYNVSLDRAAEMLAAARQGRLL